MLMVIAISAVAPVGIAQQKKADPKAKVSKKEKAAKPAHEEKESPQATKDSKRCCVFSDIEMLDICGKKVKLGDYKGKVVLIVNVASKCGFTGQYRPLQKIYEELNDQGLEVIAFPCNQFGKQEPGNEEQISSFCKKRFGIAFDIFSKVDVKGKKQAELFKRLTAMPLEPAGKGDIKWNFEKFIIGKDGKPIARFRSDVHPHSDEIVNTIKEALKSGHGNANPKDPSPEKVNTKAVDSKPGSEDKQRTKKNKNDA